MIFLYNQVELALELELGNSAPNDPLRSESDRVSTFARKETSPVSLFIE